MLGCLVAWLLGCLVAWLLGCLVAWLLGCLVAWLLGCLVAWLLGCLVISANRLVSDPSQLAKPALLLNKFNLITTSRTINARYWPPQDHWTSNGPRPARSWPAQQPKTHC